ncbi:hypothetical protein [Paenibacillus sp. H1-7]|uniref:hypothetical protein n=1 Tax=Paenibacillus sp. H1-7 TaxID=2282849 RepID=UPI001EF7F0B2|nr:hypothetical protein [Paenibacillus sp. H1-7]
MEMAFTILGMGAVDAVVTQVLREAKQQNKVIFVRVSMYLTVALMSLREVVELFHHCKVVFGI